MENATLIFHSVSDINCVPFCLLTASKLNLLLLASFDEFVIKHVLIIFDDFEEKERNSRGELKMQRGLEGATFFKLLSVLTNVSSGYTYFY